MGVRVGAGVAVEVGVGTVVCVGGRVVVGEGLGVGGVGAAVVAPSLVEARVAEGAVVTAVRLGMGETGKGVRLAWLEGLAVAKELPPETVCGISRGCSGLAKSQ
jgi:hypothetical protein